MDEDSLIAEIQQGNANAYEAIVHRYARPLRAYVAHNLPIPFLVDEISHESFLYAYRNIHDFRIGTSFLAYLKAIAWNLMRAETQRFSRRQAQNEKYFESKICELSEASSPEVYSTVLEHLQTCMSRVPAEFKKLLELKYRLSHSSEEIAQNVGQSVAWVRTTLCRIRKQLKECIDRKLAMESTS